MVIGVHTPEFTFEQDIDNVRRAAKDMNVDYPIAVDSHYAIWRAFSNRYWPALYFVDARGNIRGHQFGEGEYEGSEKVIQDLLSEAGAGDIRHDIVSVEPRDIEAAADWTALKSPENYIGYARTENFASPGGIREDVPGLYRTASALPLNSWSLAGVWTIGSEYAALNDVAAASLPAFTPATFTSSWRPPRKAIPSISVSSSTARRPGWTTVSMWIPMEWGLCKPVAFINWSGKQDRSLTEPSKSSFLSLVFVPMLSRSGRPRNRTAGPRKSRAAVAVCRRRAEGRDGELCREGVAAAGGRRLAQIRREDHVARQGRPRRR